MKKTDDWKKIPCPDDGLENEDCCEIEVTIPGKLIEQETNDLETDEKEPIYEK